MSTTKKVTLSTYQDRTYVLTSENTPKQFFLRSRHKKGSPLTFFDGKAQRALRYATNQTSVFEDEQLGEVVLEAIVFTDGRLTVPSTNPTLQEFLDKHPANASNGGILFKLHNPEQEAEIELSQFEKEVEALAVARQLPIEKIESIALAVFGSSLKNKKANELKLEVLQYARQKPDDFLHLASDDLTELIGLAKRAEEAGLARFEKGNYYNEKRMLFKVPFDIENKTEALAKWMRQDKEGDAFLKYLKKELNA